MKYRVGKQWFFPELGYKPEPGETIELEDESAQRYMQNEPGLLAPMGQTTQAKPEMVRSDKPKSTRGRAKK